MKRSSCRTVSVVAVILSFLLPHVGQAQELLWEPVTEKDWAFRRDSSMMGQDAVMLFDHTTADDRDLNNDKAIRNVYRRIKIFSAQGRSWGDVNVLFDPQTSKLRYAGGRTYLPDGTIIPVASENMLQREVLRTGEDRREELFFALPGITDSCIIDYQYAIESRQEDPFWVPQVEIPLVDGQFRWQFMKGKYTPTEQWIMTLLMGGVMAPNYLWVCQSKLIDVHMLPSNDNPEEVLFHISDLPAFKNEPYSPPEEALKARLCVYYSSSREMWDYWTREVIALNSWIFRMEADSEDIHNFVDKSFRSLPPSEDKLVAAYRWLQEHIRNQSYDRVEGVAERNKTFSDILKHGYGTRQDINYLFHAIARDLGYAPALYPVTDRRKRKFFEEGKFWQFDQSLVGLLDSVHHVHFYSPGDVALQPGEIPWWYEDVEALVVGAGGTGTRLFYRTPTTESKHNRLSRVATLRLSPGVAMSGEVSLSATGHRARDLRLLAYYRSGASPEEAMKDALSGRFEQEWRDSLTISTLSAPGRDTLSADMRFTGPPLEADAHGNFLFHPFAPFRDSIEEFNAQTRSDSIVFDYAHLDVDTIRAIVGDALGLTALPDPTLVVTRAGRVDCSVELHGDTLEIATRATMFHSHFPSEEYGQVREFCNARRTLHDLTIVFRKSIVAVPAQDPKKVKKTTKVKSGSGGY